MSFDEIPAVASKRTRDGMVQPMSEYPESAISRPSTTRRSLRAPAASAASTFDDLPAVAGGAAAAAMPNEYATEDDGPDYAALPFDEQLASKAWKARKLAYDSIAANLPTMAELPDQAAADLKLFASMLRSLCKESNPGAMDSLLEAVAAAVSHPQVFAVGIFSPSAVADALISVLMDKGLTGRPKATQATDTILKALVEHHQGEAVFNALVGTLMARAVKAKVAGCNQLAAIVADFGLGWCPAKALLKATLPLYNDADAKVRAAAANVACAAYCYGGPAVKPFFSDLREVQQQELFKQLDALTVHPPTQPPPRVLASASSSSTAGGSSASAAAPKAGGGSGALGLAANLYDEVNILAQLPKNFYATVLDKSLKWGDRNASLKDTLMPLANVPRIKASDDYTELIKALRELLVDPQMPLVTTTIQILGGIARGLGPALGPYLRPFLLPALFDKFKDKKTSLLDATSQLIGSFMQHCGLTLDACCDLIEDALASKVPNQRTAVMTWLARVVLPAANPATSARLTRNSALLIRLVNDEKVENRDAALQLIGALRDLLGERSVDAVIKTLDERQLAKTHVSAASPPMTATQPAGMMTTSSSQPIAANRPATLDADSLKSMTTSAASVLSTRSTTAKTPSSTAVSTARPTPVAGSARAAAGSAAAAPSQSAAQEADDSDAGLMKADDANCCIDTLFGCSGGLPAVWASKDWRERLELLGRLTEAAGTFDGDTSTRALEACVAALRALGWKETIFQAFAGVIALLQTLCDRPQCSCSPRVAHHIVLGVAPRLADVKLVPSIKELVLTVGQLSSLKLMHRALISVVAKLGSPKVSQLVADLIDLSMVEFAAGEPVDAKLVIEAAKTHYLEHAQPAVRTCGVKILSAVRRRCGPRVDGLIGEINPHLKQQLDQEMCNDARVPEKTRASRAAVAPSSTVARSAATSTPSVSGAGGAAAVADDDAAWPRTDISALLAAAGRDMVSAKDWKDRAQVIRRIEDGVAATGQRIAAAGVTDCIKALRLRLDDPNKNFVVDVLRCMNLLTLAAGSGGRNALRLAAVNVVQLLGDQKPNLRDEAIKFVQSAVMEGGIEVALAVMPKPLASDNQSAKSAAIDILCDAERRGMLAAAPARALMPLLQPCLRLLLDRNSELRMKGETILRTVAVNCGGLEPVARAYNDLKPAEQQLARPTMERLKAGIQVAAGGTQGGIQQPMAGGSQRVSRAPGDVAGGAPVAAAQYADPTAMAAAPALPAPAAAAAAPPPRITCSLRDMASRIIASSDGTVARLCEEYCLRLSECNGDEAQLAAFDASLTRSLLQRLLNACIAAGGSKPLNDDLIGRLLSALHATFEHRCILQRFTHSQHFEFLGIIYDLLLNTRAGEQASVVKALNALTLRCIDNSDTSAMLEATMNRLEHESRQYLDESSPVRLKYVELVARCILRIASLPLDPDLIILKCHSFLAMFPPSAFRERDDIAIRTVKTLLSSATRTHGEPFRQRCAELVGTNTLVFSFIQLCLSQLMAQQQQAQQPPAVTAAPRMSSAPSPSSVAAPPRTSITPGTFSPSTGAASSPALATVAANVVDNDFVAALFAKVRKTATSDAGLKEMYEYVKKNGNECPEWRAQMMRCSDSFRQYIERALERMHRNEMQAQQLEQR